MNPSEAAIFDAIASLSAGEFQRLAEAFAQAVEPQRYRHLVPKGRTPRAQTRAGWPDGCVILPDGSVDAVEATRDGNWKRHLEADVAKAETLGEGALAGFLFVAWAPTPTPEDQAPFYARLRRLGLDSDRCCFVFRDELVRTVAQPSCAAIWGGLLSLSASAHPFVALEQAHQIFSDGSSGRSFVPSREEYREGAVHRPSVAGLVEHQLAGRGWSFVRGHGAAGKTVLATLIGLGGGYSGSPVYYLDLAVLRSDIGAADPRPVLDVVASRGAPGVLFILDNVHREGHLARTILDYWLEGAGKGRLLLLGRWTEKGVSTRGLGDSLEELNASALHLKVEKRDLAGVFERLVAREEEMPSHEPPAEALLERWLETFGGDLVAFSFALANQLRKKIAPGLELGPAEARDYVVETYLRGRSAGEKEVLTTLAVLSSLEVSAPAELIDREAIESALDEGVALRVEANDQRSLFQLVHPGIGRLLLHALGLLDEVDRRLVDLARESPGVGLGIAVRLEAEKRPQAAAQVVSAALGGGGNLMEALSVNDVEIVGQEIWMAIRLSALRAETIDEELVLGMDQLAPRLLGGSLFTLSTFLKAASRYLPLALSALFEVIAEERYFGPFVESLSSEDADARSTSAILAIADGRFSRQDELIERLTEPAAISRIVASYLSAPPTGLRNALKRAVRMPAFSSALYAELQEERWVERIGAYLGDNVDNLADLLHYGESRPAIGEPLRRAFSLPGVAESLFDAFRDGRLIAVVEVTRAIAPYRPAFRAELTARFDDPEFAREALSVRLQHGGAPLIRLLKRTMSGFPMLAERIWRALGEDEFFVEELISAGLADSAGSLGRLLKLLRDRLPSLAARVESGVLDDRHAGRLRECLRRSSGHSVESLLRTCEVDFLKVIVLRQKGAEEVMSPEAKVRLLPRLARIFKGEEKEEGRKRLCQGLFEPAGLSNWSPSKVGLDHLASALTLGREQSEEVRTRWLERVAGLDGWGELRIDWSEPVLMLTPLLNLWLTQEEPIVEFVQERLRATSIKEQIEVLGREERRPRLVARMVGVAELYGVSPEGPLLTTKGVDKAIRQSHAVERPWMTHAQMEMWLGVRSLTKRMSHYSLPEAEAERALALLESTKQETAKEELLQGQVRSWLQGARAANWEMRS